MAIRYVVANEIPAVLFDEDDEEFDTRYLAAENQYKIRHDRIENWYKEQVLTQKRKNKHCIEKLESELRSLKTEVATKELECEAANEKKKNLEESVKLKKQKIVSLKGSVDTVSKNNTRLKEDVMKLENQLKEQWNSLAYIKMTYKRNLNFRTDYLDEDKNLITFSFFRQKKTEPLTHFVKISISEIEDASERFVWRLMDMEPQHASFKGLQQLLEETNDIQGFLAYVYKYFKSILQ